MKLNQVQSLFKIKRIKWERPKRAGIENYFFRIIKIVGKEEYAYGFRLFYRYETFWNQGKKKPYLNPITLTAISLFFYLITPAILLFAIIRQYFIELWDFAKNGEDWNAPYFAWGNILIIIILTILLILE